MYVCGTMVQLLVGINFIKMQTWILFYNNTVGVQ